MKASAFALLAGIAYLAAGLAGLVPATLVPPPEDAPPTSFALLYGYLFGLFPVNILHTAVHVAVGFWGLCAWSGKCSAAAYARALAILFGALALVGLFPGGQTLAGLMPIYGHDVWLHGVTAALAAYFGWRGIERRRSAQDRRRHAFPAARERRFGLADRRERYGATMASA